ncbi:MAG: tRNA lysidine(34) synthetase TilS [Chitinophagaceae bacterium]|jgi:tRNA(Ile)-lysidine synthase|nr:tRNA lysidine(34) synthetase TilS [Chitinophagaceae bacterium]
MNLLENFKLNRHTHFRQINLSADKFLLAVSGGIDSVVLAHLMNECNADFIIAHCNFQLRGEESDRDENFVKALAEKFQKPVLINRFDTNDYAKKNKLSIQEAARKLRYNWFYDLLNGQQTTTLNIQYIVTAHNANDNIETLLINFFRGTGISGLHGIFPNKDKLIRPLLFAKREDIFRYAQENNLQWVEDSSNASDKYTRNFFRLNILPEIKQQFPNVENILLRNIQRFGEAETLYRQAIALHKKKLTVQKGNEIHIPVLLLLKSEPLHTITYEIIKAFSFTNAQTEEVIKLLQAHNGSHIVSDTHRIIKDRKHLIIAPLETKEAQHILVEQGCKKIMFEAGTLHFEEILQHIAPGISNDVATINAEKISYPLLLRKWKTGDYFYPLGMSKKKKLNRFFIDKKMSPTDKENVWVLETDKKIVWVVGLRIDDRFKITDNTKKVLRISF